MAAKQEFQPQNSKVFSGSLCSRCSKLQWVVNKVSGWDYFHYSEIDDWDTHAVELSEVSSDAFCPSLLNRETCGVCQVIYQIAEMTNMDNLDDLWSIKVSCEHRDDVFVSLLASNPSIGEVEFRISSRPGRLFP